MHKTLNFVTNRVIERSKASRENYLQIMQTMARKGPNRAHLDCGNSAHASATMGPDRKLFVDTKCSNIGIISAYNDILSAHQPFKKFPTIIRDTARTHGCTAQFAGGVPAMCDGVTQGQPGMELSLFSREIIALSAGISLSHNTFDGVVYLGICDKIVPGLMMAAATFGHLPGIFLPSGPMPSGLPNEEKSRIRKRFANGEIDRTTLMKAEMASYHSPGTCTFYGTANSNQMLMEFMGLQLPGSSFVNPNTLFRDELTKFGTAQLLRIAARNENHLPIYKILDERAFINGIVGLMATGGSTNLILHLTAMAKSAGIILKLEDFEEVSTITPLMAKIYPNGLADVNHFHAAGGLSYIIGQLIDNGLLNEDVKTIMGSTLNHYRKEPKLSNNKIEFIDGPKKTLNSKIISTVHTPFRKSGGLKHLKGNLGTAIIKTSALSPERYVVEAPVKIFIDQKSVKEAFRNNEFKSDVIIVVRFQGPKANGMPELHSLIPIAMVLQDKGFKVGILTDGRMSGASGKVPSAIHLSPEAASDGPLTRLRDGDIVKIDANNGSISVLCDDIDSRTPQKFDLSKNHNGFGREMFNIFRKTVNSASEGATTIF